MFAEAGKRVKIDGTEYTTDANGIVTATLSSGAHSITKGDSINLFYMVFSGEGSAPVVSTTTTTTATVPGQTTTTTTSQNPVVTGPSIPSDATIIYASANGTGSGTSYSDPTDVKSAISAVPAGVLLWLYGSAFRRI